MNVLSVVYEVSVALVASEHPCAFASLQATFASAFPNLLVFHPDQGVWVFVTTQKSQIFVYHLFVWRIKVL